jgi:hypothetical protein
VAQVVAAVAAGLLLFVGAAATWVVAYQLFYAGRVFPGVSVAGVDLSGLSPDQAAVKLNQTLSYPISGKVVLRDADKVWVASPAQLGMVFEASASADAAYRVGRGSELFGALDGQVRARSFGYDVPPVIIFDQRVAYQYLQGIGQQVDQPVVEASLRVDGANVESQAGQAGRKLNVDATLIYVSAVLQSFRDGEIPLVIQGLSPTVVDSSAQAEAARQILSQPLVVEIPNVQSGDPGPWVYDVPVVAKLIRVQKVQNGDKT